MRPSGVRMSEGTKSKCFEPFLGPYPSLFRSLTLSLTLSRALPLCSHTLLSLIFPFAPHTLPCILQRLSFLLPTLRVPYIPQHYSLLSCLLYPCLNKTPFHLYFCSRQQSLNMPVLLLGSHLIKTWLGRHYWKPPSIMDLPVELEVNAQSFLSASQ